MKYTRAQVHAVRQSLNEAYDKIEKVFESIENPAHYNVFYNMCQCVIRICTVWDKRLRPKRPYSLHKEQETLYEMFSSTAMDVVEKMNNLIDIYTSAEADEAEYMRKYAETEERLRMEREIVDKLNKEKEEEIKKESKPIGFVIGQTKKKRKYTRKKNVERKSTDTPSDSESNTGDE